MFVLALNTFLHNLIEYISTFSLCGLLWSPIGVAHVFTPSPSRIAHAQISSSETFLSGGIQTHDSYRISPIRNHWVGVPVMLSHLWLLFYTQNMTYAVFFRLERLPSCTAQEIEHLHRCRFESHNWRLVVWSMIDTKIQDLVFPERKTVGAIVVTYGVALVPTPSPLRMAQAQISSSAPFFCGGVRTHDACCCSAVT